MRRRGRKDREKQEVPSMRKALQLDDLHGEGSERIGKCLDALDVFVSKIVKILRYNPVARLFLGEFLLLDVIK
jgi:hypothetical protein